jgi:flagellar hook-length control protein FliK
VIQAIDSRAAFPTDATMALKAPQRGHRFSTALENAQQETPKAPPQSRPAATQELQNRTVSRRQAPEATQEREAANTPAAKETTPKEPQRPASEASAERQPERTGETQPNEPERREPRGDENPGAIAMPDGTALRVPAQPQPATAQQFAAGQTREGLVLATPQGEQTLAQGYAPSGRVGSTLEAQLGRAAYNLSPHGVGEPVQPAYATAPSTGAIAAMKPADPSLQAIQVEPHVVNVQEMVQLSNAARSAMVAAQAPAPKTAADTAEPKRDIAGGDASSAQARNQLLAQVGGATGGAAAAVQATGGSSNGGQGDAGLLGNRGQTGLPVKDVKPASNGASAPAVSADATAAAGLTAGAATAATTHQARDSQPMAESGQRFDPAMMNKIVQESRWLIRTGHSEVTLKLQPESLGEMKLKVVHKDGDLTVQMTVDSAAAKHMLDANLKELRQQLQSENLAQGNLLLNVDVRQGGDPGGFTGFAKTAAQQGGIQPAGTPAAEEVSQASRAQPATWGNSNISIYA